MTHTMLSPLVVVLVLACALAACGTEEPVEPPTTTTSGAETADTTDGVEEDVTVAPPSDANDGPQAGSPECAGCTHSSSPGHARPGGGGGTAEWCISSEPEQRMCPMSCCRAAR